MYQYSSVLHGTECNLLEFMRGKVTLTYVGKIEPSPVSLPAGTREGAISRARTVGRHDVTVIV